MNEAPSSFGLTKTERKKLDEVTMEINKKLLSKNTMACTPTQLLHTLIEISLEKVDVDKYGRVTIK